MQRILSKIHDLGAELVAISPIQQASSLTMAEKNGLTFLLLSDHGNTYARQCGLVFTMAEKLQPLYKGWGIDLPATNGDSSHELPLPATYVVNRDSRITLSFLDVDYTHRLEPAAILAALTKISVT